MQHLQLEVAQGGACQGACKKNLLSINQWFELTGMSRTLVTDLGSQRKTK